MHVKKQYRSTQIPRRRNFRVFQIFPHNEILLLLLLNQFESLETAASKFIVVLEILMSLFETKRPRFARIQKTISMNEYSNRVFDVCYETLGILRWPVSWSLRACGPWPLSMLSGGSFGRSSLVDLHRIPRLPSVLRTICWTYYTRVLKVPFSRDKGLHKGDHLGSLARNLTKNRLA